MLGILTLTGCSKSPEDKTAATSEPKAAATNGETIKVGILHSLSGTMAISETSLKDTALMAINEINANGGVLGKKLEPVIVDPASDWPLFAEKHVSSSLRIKLRSSLVAGLRYHVNRYCQWLKS